MASSSSSSSSARAAPTAGHTWCTIESDPGVFSALVEQLGAKDVAVEELWDLDDDALARAAPAYGLVFLFKWTPERDERAPLRPEETPSGLFFARQTITNACATQALLSMLLNARDKVDVGPTLAQFGEFSREFDPELRGELIGESDAIRDVHNSFARPEPFVEDDAAASKRSRKDEEKEDAFHFIAYVPFQGHVYELDGLKPGPFRLGEIPSPSPSGGGSPTPTEETMAWMRVVKPHIQARIAKYAETEIRFNLMVLLRDRVAVHRERVQQLEEQAALALSEGRDVPLGVATELEHAKTDLADAEERKRSWAVENERRKHNYVPFIVAVLKLLAKRKKLRGLVKQAQERSAQRLAAAQPHHAPASSSSSS